MSKRKKTAITVIIAVTILLIASSLYVVEYTTPGYRMSVAMHGFTQVADHIFVDQHWQGDTNQLLLMIGEARERVRAFFGVTMSNPTVIICDDKQKLALLGGDHDTFTVMFFQASSYISVSSDWLNVDVLAHEFTHAEVHTRVFRGGISFDLPIPTWLDEGLAIQNDYREQYNEQTWLRITENGENVPSIEEYNTAAKFYAGDTEARRQRYCLAGHEVAAWIKQHGKDKMITMLNKTGQGVAFSSMYFEEK